MANLGLLNFKFPALAKDFHRICHPTALATVKFRLPNELPELFRVLFEVLFGPITNRLRHFWMLLRLSLIYFLQEAKSRTKFCQSNESAHNRFCPRTKAGS